METTNNLHVLYWYAYTDKQGDVDYCLMFENQKERMGPCGAARAMMDAERLQYPVICIN